MFTTDYRPNVSLRRVGWVQQPTVDTILRGELDHQQSASLTVHDPTEWNGYVYRYQGCSPGSYNLAFLRDSSLEEGQTYQWTRNVIVFSAGRQLLETEVQTGDGSDDGCDGESGTERPARTGADGGDRETPHPVPDTTNANAPPESSPQ